MKLLQKPYVKTEFLFCFFFTLCNSHYVDVLLAVNSLLVPVMPHLNHINYMQNRAEMQQ